MIGLSVPNDGAMGTVGGNGAARPYGNAPATSAAPTDSVPSFGGVDSAQANIGYRPTAGRADRLGANIVGGNGVGKF